MDGRLDPVIDGTTSLATRTPGAGPEPAIILRTSGIFWAANPDFFTRVWALPPFYKIHCMRCVCMYTGHLTIPPKEEWLDSSTGNSVLMLEHRDVATVAVLRTKALSRGVVVQEQARYHHAQSDRTCELPGSSLWAVAPHRHAIDQALWWAKLAATNGCGEHKPVEWRGEECLWASMSGFRPPPFPSHRSHLFPFVFNVS